MNGAQVRVLEKSDEVGLGGLLKSEDRRSLEAKITLEVLGDLTDKTLEGKFSDEKVSRLLVATNLSEGHGAWAVTVGLLHSSGSRS
jgi:hypothetical protein